MTELPIGWDIATVGEVTARVSVLDPRVISEENFTYVDIGSIDNRTNRIVAPKLLKPAEAPSRARQLLEAGDTVVSTVRTYLRNIAYVEHSLSGAIASTGFAVLRPARGIEPRFLHYYALTRRFVDGLTSQMRGTSYPAVVDSQVRAMPIPVPPTAEQQRIVVAIDVLFLRIDAGLAAMVRLRQNLSRMRKAVLQAAVTGRLSEGRGGELPFAYLDSDDPLGRRLSGENAAKVKRAAADLAHQTWQVPPRWRWLSAAEVSELVSSGSTPSPNAMSAGHGDIPYIKVYNLTDHGALDFSVRPTFISHATHTGPLKRSRLQPGDILTNIVGPPLGKVAVVPADYAEWNTNQAVVVFRPIRSLHPALLKYWLLSPGVLALLESTSRATAGQFNVSLTTCRALPLPIPPRHEQDAIVDLIDEHLSRIEYLEQVAAASVANAARLRAAILDAAFSGQLVYQDGNDEPASVLLGRIAASSTEPHHRRSTKMRRIPRKRGSA